MPKNIDPGQRAQKKDARKGAAFFALVQLAMALLLLWGVRYEVYHPYRKR